MRSSEKAWEELKDEQKERINVAVAGLKDFFPVAGTTMIGTAMLANKILDELEAKDSLELVFQLVLEGLLRYGWKFDVTQFAYMMNMGMSMVGCLPHGPFKQMVEGIVKKAGLIYQNELLLEMVRKLLSVQEEERKVSGARLN